MFFLSIFELSFFFSIVPTKGGGWGGLCNVAVLVLAVGIQNVKDLQKMAHRSLLLQIDSMK